jgi:hypothetical protein
MSEKVACPECGEEYKQLGQHWRWNKHHRPSFTDYQKEVITGLLMGDGCIRRSDKNPRIQCEMISPNYLEYISYIFGCLGTGVSLKCTAEENAKRSRNSGFRPNAKSENYSDVYYWRSRNNPELEEFADWYSTGEKLWPEDIELTPTVLKHWYCGDGCWQNKSNNNCIKISMANEIENQDKVSQMFKKVGLPTPSNYVISERKDGGKTCGALWTIEQSKKLWDYMGEPLPDFYYKWPEEYH